MVPSCTWTQDTVYKEILLWAQDSSLGSSARISPHKTEQLFLFLESKEKPKRPQVSWCLSGTASAWDEGGTSYKPQRTVRWWVPGTQTHMSLRMDVGERLTFTFSWCHPCSSSSLFVSLVFYPFFYFLSTDTSQNQSRRTSTEKRFPWDCYRQDCGGIFLIVHWLRKIHTPMDRVFPGHMVLSGIKVMTELVKRSKPGSNIPHALCFSSWLWVPASTSLHDACQLKAEINPFLPTSLSATVFNRAIEGCWGQVSCSWPHRITWT